MEDIRAKNLKYIKECIIYSILIKKSSFFLDKNIGSDFYRLKKEDYKKDKIFSVVYNATCHLKNIKIKDIVLIGDDEPKILVVFLYENQTQTVEVG